LIIVFEKAKFTDSKYTVSNPRDTYNHFTHSFADITSLPMYVS